jgi:uncharacterized protein YecE (DUF72 family)
VPSSGGDPPRTLPLIGTAGWSIPRDVQGRFPEGASHLVRYSGVFNAAEINSSFHRPHRPSTYQRWAETVPPDFRFSAKLPKTVTHTLKLAGTDAAVDAFLAESSGLGDKLACLLVQLPPSLSFDAGIADAFFRMLRDRFSRHLACEPRHPSWFEGEADALLAEHRVARVAADPARVPEAAEPGGWPGLVYHRLHGSPRIYYSPYPDGYLDALAARLRKAMDGGAETWCIFDNTASGAAAGNALDLRDRLTEHGR